MKGKIRGKNYIREISSILVIDCCGTSQSIGVYNSNVLFSQSWGLRRVGLALHTVQARALTRPPSAGSLTGAARPEMASHPLGLFPHLGSLAHASWELLASKRENTEHVSPRFKAYVWKPPECHRCHGLLVQATSEGRLLFKLLTGRAAKHV